MRNINEYEYKNQYNNIIINKCCFRIQQYLVKWLGYLTSENTWEPEGNLGNAAVKVREFENKSGGMFKKGESVIV